MQSRGDSKIKFDLGHDVAFPSIMRIIVHDKIAYIIKKAIERRYEKVDEDNIIIQESLRYNNRLQAQETFNVEKVCNLEKT